MLEQPVEKFPSILIDDRYFGDLLSNYNLSSDQSYLRNIIFLELLLELSQIIWQNYESCTNLLNAFEKINGIKSCTKFKIIIQYISDHLLGSTHFFIKLFEVHHSIDINFNNSGLLNIHTVRTIYQQYL